MLQKVMNNKIVYKLFNIVGKYKLDAIEPNCLKEEGGMKNRIKF